MRARTLVAFIVSASSLLVAAPVFAADPVQFATLSGSCTNGGTTVNGAPVASPHSDIIVRYTAASGSGSASLDFNTVGGGDVVWWPWPNSLDTNDHPSVFASCTTPHGFTAAFFDVPSTPTTFSGVGNTAGSLVTFGAPGAGQYVATLTLGGGGVSVDDGANVGPVSFASSGQYPMGTIAAGAHQLAITALAGPRPTWSLTIQALPVAISNLTFGRTATRPGVFIQAKYSVTGDTSISAVVRNAGGQPVKTLATALAVGQGGNSLAWDATSDAGLPLLDGTYTLELDSLDPSGQSTAATTTIVVDGTPPAIAVTSPSSITTAGAISGQITDALTGVASAGVNNAALQFAPGQTGFVYHPAGGFGIGPQSIVISATDGAGNQRLLTYGFTVVSNSPTSSSTKAPAKHASPAKKKVAPVPFIRCTRSSGSGVTLPQRRPKSCLLFGPGGAFGGGVNLAALHWKSWGAATITGTGVEKGFHSFDRPFKVKVTLFRIVKCGPLRFYTRVRATSRLGTTVTRAINLCATG